MYNQISANKRKTFFLMLGFFILLWGLAYIFSKTTGNPGLLFTIGLFSLGYALFSYFAGAKMALAINGAKEISKKDAPAYWRIVENLAITNGMPMPKVYIMEDPSLNAFATGRDPNHSAVCATTGLLNALDNNELEGVMAHELGHIKNYDIRVSTIAFALVGIISMIADFFLRMTFFGGNNDNNAGRHPYMIVLAIAAAIIAPLTATMLQLAISRRREYLADATGALTTRYPEGLASALEKISAQGSATAKQNTSTAHMFIANPLKGKGFSALFSTHPPASERIKILREMNL